MKKGRGLQLPMETHGLAIAPFTVWVEADKGQKLQVRWTGLFYSAYGLLWILWGIWRSSDPLLDILNRDPCQGSLSRINKRYDAIFLENESFIHVLQFLVVNIMMKRKDHTGKTCTFQSQKVICSIGWPLPWLPAGVECMDYFGG